MAPQGYVAAAGISDIPQGTMKTVRIAGRNIALINVDGEIFAVDDTCTHAQCSLGNEGFLEGQVITCGCHGAQYDVTTGKVLGLPATVDIQSYPVRITDNTVYVAVPTV